MLQKQYENSIQEQLTIQVKNTLIEGKEEGVRTVISLSLLGELSEVNEVLSLFVDGHCYREVRRLNREARMRERGKQKTIISEVFLKRR